MCKNNSIDLEEMINKEKMNNINKNANEEELNLKNKPFSLLS
jgi:hypothetical protein